MFARLLANLREHGAGGALFKFFERLVGLLSRHRVASIWYVLVAQPVAGQARLPARLGASIAIRRVERDEPILRQAPRPEAVIHDRFRQGSVCHAAVRDGQLLGFIWLCPSRYVEDEVRCVYEMEPASDLVWDFDVWVQPDFRQGIVFAKLWAAAHQYLLERDVHWTASRISRLNAGSLAAHSRMGARKLGDAWFFLGRRWQCMLATVPPFLHVSLDPARQPTLRLIAPSAALAAELNDRK